MMTMETTMAGLYSFGINLYLYQPRIPILRSHNAGDISQITIYRSAHFPTHISLGDTSIWESICEVSNRH